MRVVIVIVMMRIVGRVGEGEGVAGGWFVAGAGAGSFYSVSGSGSRDIADWAVLTRSLC